LASGKYRLLAVQLDNGYSASLYSPDLESFVTLAPDQPHRLKVGPPLKPSVKIKREGRHLKMDYRLADASGHSYTGHQRTNPPTFSVTKDGRELGSGTFAYG
jgi:hypothetical protein